MTDAEKIKAIRKYYKLSQTTFGEKLGVTRDVIANVEKGRTKLKPLLAKMICKTYNIDADWLETGQSEMIDLNVEKLNEYGLSDKETKFISCFLQMDRNERISFIDAIDVIMNLK